MSDYGPPELPQHPVAARRADSPATVRPGSMSKGIGLAWLIVIVGEFFPLMLAGDGKFSLVGALFVPPLAVIVTGVVLLVRTRSRTGTGLLLGLLSVMAAALLLVAACFGLLVFSHH